jgi:tetratricopeptide (TPR) repeat protein
MLNRIFRFLSVLAAVLIVCALQPSAKADEIHLKNGHVVTGSIIREDSREVVYDQADGEYTLPRSIVERVVRTAPAESGSNVDQGGSSSPSLRAPLPAIRQLDFSDAAFSKVVKDNKVDDAELQRLDELVLRNPTDENRYRLALGYRAAGAFLAQTGDANRAVELYRHALNFAPNDLGLTVALGYMLVTQKQYSQTMDLLLPAGTRFPRSADVPLLLGSAYYYTENLDRAIEEWKHSLELQKDPRVEEALAKAERERAVAGSYLELRNEHFLLRYQGEDTRPLAEQVLQTLNKDFASLEADLDVYPRETIIVLLYPDQAFGDITRLPAWVGAENDGKIRIPVSGLSAVNPQLERILKHELTHSFVYQATLGRCPVWFNEGLAQLEEGPNGSGMDALLARALASGQSLPFDSLETSFFDLPKEKVGMAYLKSLAAVEYLRDTFGMAEIRRLLMLIPTQPDFSALLESETRLDYSQLEQNLTAYMAKRAGI